MVKELAYGEDGSLYRCDVGQREVYRLFPDKKTVSTVVKRNEFSTLKSDNFAETPLYTGLNVSNGKVSVLSSEYVYDEEADEEILLLQISDRILKMEKSIHLQMPSGYRCKTG